jgi:hypothetical protein
MSVDYTNTALISNIKRRASVPTNQNLFDETTFLDFLTDEMLSNLVPLIMSVREEYFTQYKDETLVDGTDEYLFPRRAIGQKLKNVVFVDANGKEHPCPRLGSKDRERDESVDGGRLGGIIIRDNYVQVFPNAKTFLPYSLRMYYYRRPSHLVKTSQCAQITVINTGTKTVTVSVAPTAWTTATTFDIIKNKPGFESLGDDLTITAKVGLDFTFTDALPSTLEVGDWLAEAGESPIAQIPYEMHATLAQQGSTKLMEALGHQAGLQAAQAKLQIQEKNALTLVTPRIDDKPKRLVSRRGIWKTGGTSWRK